MGKRKTAQRGPATSKAPESKRRWLILNAKAGKPMLGGDEGVTIKDRARRISESYLMETEVVLYHEYHGLPDPDEVSE